MKIFNSIGHFFAWVISTALPTATKEVQAVESAVASPLASAIASLLGGKGTAVQSGIEAIAGDVLNAFGAAGAAIGEAGLNVSFDEATVTAIKAIYTDLQALFGKGAAPATSTSTAATTAAGK